MSHFSKWTLSPHWYLYFSFLLFGCGCWCPIEEGGQCGFGECDYGNGSEYDGQRTGQQWEKHLGHALGTRNIKARWEKWERKSDEKFHTIKNFFFFYRKTVIQTRAKTLLSQWKTWHCLVLGKDPPSDSSWSRIKGGDSSEGRGASVIGTGAWYLLEIALLPEGWVWEKIIERLAACGRGMPCGRVWLRIN